MRNISAKRAAKLRARRTYLAATYPDRPPCARCGQPADDAHEVLSRARGGQITGTNVIPLCRHCHSWVTTHPDQAEEAGWSR